MTLLGQPHTPRRIAEALAAGIAYIPPDRSFQGLAGDMSLAENLFFNPRAGTAGGLRHPKAERLAAREILTSFGVRPPDPSARIAHLSGGNAQKVLLARWLHKTWPLLVINDPTVGVDVRSREDIYAHVRAAAAAGAAVLLITADFEEVQALALRAHVMVRGLISATLGHAYLTVPAIIQAIARSPRARAYAAMEALS